MVYFLVNCMEKYSTLEFGFANGGNPDTYLLAIHHSLSFHVDYINHRIRTTVETSKAEKITGIVLQYGYQLVGPVSSDSNND